MRLFLFLCAFLLNTIVSAQDAGKLLRQVNNRFQKVRDYQADLRLKADIPFIKMLPVNAKIYFRQPYQMRIKSTGIAILPRQGFDQVFKALSDTNSYVSVYQGTDPNDRSEVVSIIPVSDTSDLVLGKFWIDGGAGLIKRSQITTKSNGTIYSEYFYGKHSDMALPDSLIVTVDTKKFKIPKAVAADINNYNAQAKDPSAKSSKGKIYMRFSNYRINQGLPDDVFKEERKK